MFADDELTATCTSYLLRTLYPWLDASYQASICNELSACTRGLPLNVASVDLSGLPVLHAVRPLDMPAELAPISDPLTQGLQGRLDIAVDEDEEEEEAEQQMGSCVRLRRAEQAANGDVFLSRPNEEAQGKKSARMVRGRRPQEVTCAGGEACRAEFLCFNSSPFLS